MANLPLQTMPFIGRDDEIVGIAQQLADPACGLLTLVGSGGMGKTRLAIEVAKYIAETQPPLDGIYFVDLQPVNEDHLLIMALASTLNILMAGSEDPRTQLLNYLNGRDSLLLLDNFEQLLGSVDLLADVVKFAPTIKLLVTSREALNIQEEWVWEVGGLQVPTYQPEASIESYSAVQLFVERARRSHQNFTLIGQETDVTRTCQLVEGMPLALELAASWTKALSCAEIVNEIQQGLDFLTTNKRNVLERHQSIQAVFDHSWRLLTEAERQAFPRLSVFRGGFRREAAEQVAGASLAVLAGLVDKSFLRVTADGRYSIQELLRQYGEEHLEAMPDAKKNAQNHHCVYYAGFLYQRQATLRTPEQAAALDEIEAELDNIRESWEWAVEHDLRDEIHQSMHSLYVFCHIRPQSVEGERLLSLAVKRFEHEDSATLAYLLLAHNCMQGFNGRSCTDDQFHRGIRLASTLWTQDEIAILIGSNTPLPEGLGLNEPLFSTQRMGKIAVDFLEIFRSHNQVWGETFMGYYSGVIAHTDGNLAEADRYYRQSMNDFLQMGDRWASAWSSNGLARVLDVTQRYQESLEMWQQHEDVCAEVGDWGGVVYALAMKASATRKLHDYHAARLYVSQAIKIYLESGSPLMHLTILFESLVDLYVSENRHEHAAEILSFLRQYADKTHGLEIVAEADQGLVLIAQKLPSNVYKRAVECGKKLHFRTILEQLEEELAEYSPSEQNTLQTDALSERELEVLRLTAAGHSNRQIANDLVLTLNTVKSHIHHIYGKLGVASRTQAVARARELELL